jgi:hypothetical protein
MNSPLRWASVALLLLATACSFHSTATHWNGLRDADGKPVFVKTTTNIGLNLLVILPFLGNTSLDSMVDETTRAIAKEGGDRARVIQSSSENYWYGSIPVTYVLTPIVTEIAIEYEPSAEEIAKVMAARVAFDSRQKVRRDEDNSHIVPVRR